MQAIRTKVLSARRATGPAAVAAALVLLAGCAGGEKAPAAGGRAGKVEATLENMRADSLSANGGTFSTGLAALSGDDGAGPAAGNWPTPGKEDAAAMARQAALDLERIMREGGLDAARAPAPRASTSGVANTPPPAAPAQQTAPDAANTGLAALVGDAAVQDAAGGEKPEPAEVVATAQKPTPTAPAALQTADDVVVDMAMRIAALLRAPVAEGQGRIPEPLALASIEALRPGSLAELDNPSSVLSSRLSSEDRETLRNARDRVAADTSAATQAISQSINKVAPQATLSITRSALAKKVSGHGRYEPFPGETFMAGRPLRAIVYVELENFAARPARVGDPIQRGIPVTEQVSVDLAQSISLFHDATGLLAWHRPAQAVVETGRSKRRDFYLIQLIELPATLGVGKYNLKVTVRDNTTGAETEAVLPVHLVADSALASPR